MTKVNLADGFYCVWIKASNMIKLDVSFPILDGKESVIAFPIVLPMGWTNSPPWFSGTTEMIANIANKRIAKWHNSPVYCLEAQASTAPEPMPIMEPTPAALAMLLPLPISHDPNLQCAQAHILASVDIFVDNFLGAAQGTPEHLNSIPCILFNAIDDVFHALDNQDPAARCEPILVKTLPLGNACWTTNKKLLGWILDTLQMTITHPTNSAE
jgi:hypothetical protein